MRNKYLFLIALLLLSACSSPDKNSAATFMREQQDKQADIRQAENEQAKQALQDQPALLLSIIQENINERNFFAAQAYINSYINNFGDTPEVAILHANALRNTGQETQAKAIYTQELKRSHKAEALHGLGLLAAKAQQYDQAISYLQQAAQLKPTDAVLLSDLGFAHLSLGQTQAARIPLGQAIELNDDNPRIMANVALLLLLEQHTTQAQQLMTKAGMDQSTQNEVEALAQKLRYQKSVQAAPTTEQDGNETVPASVPLPKPRHIPLTRSSY